jgi:membrane fusion protein, multidrug efflux system
VIPSVAVQRGPQGSFVYVVKADKTVEARPVTVALSQSNQSAISSGLQPGDIVVNDGQDKLQNGAKVEPRSRPGNSSAVQPASATPAS